MRLIEISLSDKKNWQKELNGMLTYDAYHTPDYIQLSIEKSNQSFLLSFRENNYNICFPIVVRNIKNSSFYDASSVYGYSGLLSNNINIPEPVQLNFKKSLFEYFSEKNIISAFSRLHPLIPLPFDFAENPVTIENVNTTVFIDLTLSDKDQIKQSSGSLHRQIKKMKESGVTVRLAKENEYPLFASMYLKTMNRLNAKEEYLFSDDYFKNIIHASDFQSFILFAEFEGKTIGGGLFLCCNEFMQYHLGAVPDEYLHLSPLKIIIDSAREIGRQKGLKYLHLGGGYAGKDDNLFQFKSRFSKKRSTFSVWKWIINPSEYNHLVKERFGNHIPESNYFPLYRL